MMPTPELPRLAAVSEPTVSPYDTSSTRMGTVPSASRDLGIYYTAIVSQSKVLEPPRLAHLPSAVASLVSMSSNYVAVMGRL